MTSGVYMMTNKVTGKHYIGQSMDIEVRIRGHFCIKAQKNERLREAMIKHGRDHWIISVLFISDDLSARHEKEKEYIVKYDTVDAGYNTTYGGHGFEGAVHSDETINKIRKSLSGRAFSDETRKKISSAKSVKIRETTKGRIFDSIAAASKYYGISGYNISLCCDTDTEYARNLCRPFAFERFHDAA